jgi:transposase
MPLRTTWRIGYFSAVFRVDVALGKMGGHRRRVLEPYRAFIIGRIEQTSHLTLHRLKDELAAHGVTVSHNAIWQFMRREGFSFKKNAIRP